jgi:hypothetical protein
MSVSTRGIVCTALTPRRSNTLRAFISISLQSGMEMHDLSLHVSGPHAWVSPASKPMLDRNGVAMRDEAGKIKYVPLISFQTKEIRDRFSESVIEAVRLAYPDVLAGDAS